MQMKRIGILTLVWLVGATGGLADGMKKYHESAIPRELSEWSKSDDGKLSVCLSAGRTTFGTNELLKIRCAVRNTTDDTITILRPFGDTFYAHSAGLHILGPDGLISYRGAMKEYVLGTTAFMELPAHSIVEETLELPTDIFPGLGKPGIYVVGYVFLSDGYPKKPLPGNFWSGRIKTSSVTILLK
jgi:hypothetical protein